MNVLEPVLAERIAAAVREDRLVATASELVAISSPTGEELDCGTHVRGLFEELGLQVAWQEVEDGRPNVVGTLRGAGGGPNLMFNGHLDTSYSGREPWLTGIGYRPEATVRDGRIWGLGISNMKGALACYIEALRALMDAGVQLRGDLQIAAVCGEIEKAQWGEFRGREFRGYATGSRHLPCFGAVPDVCILGEATENRVVLAHFGAMWARISTTGPFVHTAWSGERLAESSIVRMRDALGPIIDWVDAWRERGRLGDTEGVVNIGAIRGGFPWRASRTPGQTDLFLDIRVPPSMSMQDARRAFDGLVAELRERFPEFGIEHEIFVSAPGSQIAEDHPLVRAIDDSHLTIFGERPAHDVVRWFCDASPLTRYGIDTVIYGTSSGLPGPDGENLDIAGLVAMTRSYALAATQVCEASPGPEGS